MIEPHKKRFGVQVLLVPQSTALVVKGSIEPRTDERHDSEVMMFLASISIQQKRTLLRQTVDRKQQYRPNQKK